MKLHAPFLIGARLLPALRIGDAWLSLQAANDHRNEEGRSVASFVLDLPDGGEHIDRTLQSGVGGSFHPVEAFETYLSFLLHAGESSDEEAAGMFTPAVVAWARDNVSELECAQCDLRDETGVFLPNLIEV